jgi:hypothetical protein
MHAKSIFNINLYHEYFSNKPTEYLACLISTESTAVLNAHGLECRHTERGCTIVHESDKGKGTHQRPPSLKEAVQLRFYIQTDNPYFRMFTDMSHGEVGRRAFHFTNAGADGSVRDVFYDDRKSVGKKDLKLINRKAFTYVVSNPDTKKVTVYDRNQEAVATRELEDPSDFFIDLWDHPDGMYTITEDHTLAQTIVTTSAEPTNFVGYIDVVLTPERVEAALFADNPLEFKLNFKAREVFWKYILVSDEAVFGRYQIRTDGTMKFKEEPIQEGSVRRRNTYVATRKTKLKERYKLELNLYEVATNELLISGLAHPKAESMQPIAAGSADSCLEIYLVI